MFVMWVSSDILRLFVEEGWFRIARLYLQLMPYTNVLYLTDVESANFECGQF